MEVAMEGTDEVMVGTEADMGGTEGKIIYFQ